MIWIWSGFIGFILLMLALDLGVFHRKAHVVEMKEALSWSAVWILLGLAFSVFVYYGYEHRGMGLGTAVDGVDGVFMGPYDLSLSYGIPGRIGDPVMVEARRKVLAACKKAGKAPGIHELGMTRESVKQVVDEGFLFIALGVDAAFVDRGAREALKNARDAAGR